MVIKSHYDAFKKLLKEMKDKALEEMPRVTSIKSEKLADDVDIASLDTEQAMATRFQARKALFVRKIDHALLRIDDGTYGYCSTCTDEISVNRLMARPTALLCVDCKEDQETEENRRKNPNSISIHDIDQDDL